MSIAAVQHVDFSRIVFAPLPRSMPRSDTSDGDGGAHRQLMPQRFLSTNEGDDDGHDEEVRRDEKGMRGGR